MGCSESRALAAPTLTAFAVQDQAEIANSDLGGAVGRLDEDAKPVWSSLAVQNTWP